MWSSFAHTFHPYIYPDGSFNENAYGPLFLLLTPFYVIHPAFPKLVIVIFWFLTGIFLHTCIHEKKSKLSIWIWCSIFLNPFFYVLFLVYGINEVIMSFFILTGVHYLEEKKEIPSGILLGLGMLFKIIPIFLFPFLALKNKKILSIFSMSFIITVSAGMLVSFIVWNREAIIPFVFAATRNSSFLSFFYFFRTIFHTNIDFLSLPLLVISLAIVLYFHHKKNFSISALSIIVLLTVLLFYKVNHPQYHTTILLLLLYFYIENRKKISFNSSVFITGSIYFLWISIIPLFYIFMNEFHGQWEIVRSWIGLPTTIIMSVFLLTFFHFSHKLRVDK
jgi:hypothetical protein